MMRRLMITASVVCVLTGSTTRAQEPAGQPRPSTGQRDSVRPAVLGTPAARRAAALLLLRQAQRDLAEGRLDEAEHKVRQAQQYNVIYTLSDERPETILAQIQSARRRRAKTAPWSQSTSSVGPAASGPIALMTMTVGGEPEPLKSLDTEPLTASDQRASSPGASAASAMSVRRELDQLKQRIGELETARTAHEDATRTIIRRTFEERGSQINDFVTLGGTFELLTAWSEDFDGTEESDIVLDTAELDFEVQVSDWTLGEIVFEYVEGTDVLFPTSSGDEAAVDRINIDTATVTIGDTQRFWLFGTFGRMIVPFGISTGAAKGDVLNIIDPLTVEIFETKEDAILIGFELPTPPPPPKPTTLVKPGPVPPPVKPILINPFFYGLSRHLGYKPLPPLPPGEPIPPSPTITPPPFTGAIYFYNGDTTNGGDEEIEHIGGSLGYRTQGICSWNCLPWSLDMDVDVNSSVFDSEFLEFEYRHFLDQIRYVPGMAAHIKSTMGPVSLIAEWNGAISHATLVDDLGDDVEMRPQAWQVSLGYQFDWNPSVVEIGAQGTYFAIGYSESYDMAGVARLIDGEVTRVGFVPRRRFVVGLGEWVLEGLRVAVEYSHAVDYSESAGGTGESADGVFGQLTYEW